MMNTQSPSPPATVTLYIARNHVSTSRHEVEGFAEMAADVHQEPVEIREVTVHLGDSKHVMSRLPKQIEVPVAVPLDFCVDEASAYECDEPKTNPRAWPIRLESEWIGDEVASISKELITADGYDGLDGFAMERGGMRALTNEECCQATFILSNVEKSFDIRRPLPRAIAKWIRGIAGDLLKAADKIEAIDDDRPRALIRRFVAEDPAVKYDRHRGLIDTTKPLPPVRWPD